MREAEVETQDSGNEGRPTAIEAGEPGGGASSWSLSVAKRIVDITVALLVLVAALVPGAFVCLLIRITSAGSVFFRQQRVGHRGRLFTLYKLRTMDATEDGDGPWLTRDGDTRVTGIGKVLRKVKLDELPQFYNVLRGEMSLVGPRPKLAQYAAETDQLYRPGITGFATLWFRGEEQLLKEVGPEDVESFYERRIKPLKARADARYMRRASFMSDAGILLRTAVASLGPSLDVMRKKWARREVFEGAQSRAALGVESADERGDKAAVAVASSGR